MTPIQNRIDAFAKLGDFLRQFSRREIIKNDFVVYNDLFLMIFNIKYNLHKGITVGLLKIIFYML